MKNTVISTIRNQDKRNAAKAQIYAMLITASLFMANPANAQSLRQTGESIFNTLYGLVGVVGGISGLVCAINWKAGNFLGVQDPKKAFFNAMIGTGLGFGIVGIIQFIKSAVSSGGGISGV